MKPIRWAFQPVQAVTPALAARIAERLFFTPQRTRASRSLSQFVATGRRFELRVDGRRVVGWRWGQGPVVYLVHGWGSRGGRLSAFAAPLLDAGFSVVTFDAPGHGASGHGMSSMPEFGRTLKAIVSREGPAHAVIAHSMGAAATVLTVAGGLSVNRLVLLAPPANPSSWVTQFAKALGLRADVVHLMQARSEARLRFRWAELDVARAAQGLGVPLLIAHDAEDKVVPWRDGAAIAEVCPGARLVTTLGLGHSGIARAPGIVKEVVEFVCGDEVSPARADEASRLEDELFHRDLRWELVEEMHGGRLVTSGPH